MNLLTYSVKVFILFNIIRIFNSYFKWLQELLSGWPLIPYRIFKDLNQILFIEAQTAPML